MKRFAVTLFVSATLLFACQPMVARMIVPLLGGAPAVWILCSLCFQALVLAGYAYAHVVGSRLPLSAQVALQVVLVASAFFVLPIAVNDAFVESLTAWSPSLGLLAALLRIVGLPFFVLATTSPLLQRWYADLGETDPYHLYAASNAGSMLALVGYPFLVEPFVPLRQQSRGLQLAFVLYTLLVGLCAVTTLRKRHPPPSEAVPAPAGQTMSEDIGAHEPADDRAVFPDGRSPWRDRAVWLALAFVPSSLLMGATEFITTDLASTPLLWVLPLALYLASFIVAFAKKQTLKQSVMSRVLAGISVLLGLTLTAEARGPAYLIVGLNLLFLFVAAVVCHRALAVRRPHHRRLTEFYLVMSLGGVLGGAFNGLLAPVLFRNVTEYPIAIGLALLVRVAVDPPPPNATSWRRDVVYALAVVAFSFFFVQVQRRYPVNYHYALAWMYLAPMLFAYRWNHRPIRFAVAMGGMLLVSITNGGLIGRTLLTTRDFYGVLRLSRDPTDKYLLLLSGNTLHGAEALAPERKHIPLTYYSEGGPVGDVLGPLPAPGGPPLATPRRVGVLGLGVGSLVSYARPEDHWTLFELSPTDVAMAREHFTYLSSVPPTVKMDIEVGDARLRIRDGAAQRFDVLVLDAFSSDAIPTHLLTREAFALYRRALVPSGLLLVHISNRHLNLEPVVAALTADAKLVGMLRDAPSGPDPVADSASLWICLGESRELFAPIAAKNAAWHDLVPVPGQKVWTDDFANVLAAMHF